MMMFGQDNETIWGIDKPLVRRCDINIALQPAPVYMFWYRAWTITAIIHTVDGTLRATVCGSVILPNLEMRTYDAVAFDQDDLYRPDQIVAFIARLADTVQAVVNDGWLRENSAVREAVANYESFVRDQHRLWREGKIPQPSAPWAKAGLN